MSARQKLLAAAAELFDQQGYDATSVAQLCAAAGVSNGSFFHVFRTKDTLAAQLYLAALEDYHAALIAALTHTPAAQDGIASLIHAHLNWVTFNRREAEFLFNEARSSWLVHIAQSQAEENKQFGESLAAWVRPLMETGDLHTLPMHVFVAQLIGPVQIFCRAWLSGRSSDTPDKHADDLIECATRTLACSHPSAGTVVKS